MELSPEALLFLLTGIPKLIRLEEGVGLSTTHAEIIEAFDAYLESVEPAATIKRRPSGRRGSKREA